MKPGMFGINCPGADGNSPRFARTIIVLPLWAYGVVVSMFDFHRSDRGSNPGPGGKIS